MGTPEEVADVVAFLATRRDATCTAASSTSTGACTVADAADAAEVLARCRSSRRSASSTRSSRSTTSTSWRVPLPRRTPTSTAATSPGNPVTPGVLLLESMAQAGVVALGIYLLAQEPPPEEAEQLVTLFTDANVEFTGMVPPGERVTDRGRKVFFRRRKLRSEVEMRLEDGTLVCAARSPAWGCRDERARRRHRPRRHRPERQRPARRSSSRCARAAPACARAARWPSSASAARSPACRRASTSSRRARSPTTSCSR